MNIDYSKFVLKCNVDDCGQNKKQRCCLSCESYEDCKKKNWICIHLTDFETPENCSELYIKRELI